MPSLIETADHYKKLADELLESSGLLKMLAAYGTPKLGGSYAYDLMMHGDIDIHVLRDRPFTKEETLKVFGAIVPKLHFNSYYLGDRNDVGALSDVFPSGYYIGFKIKGQQIYEMVIKDGVMTLEGFKKRVESGTEA